MIDFREPNPAERISRWLGWFKHGPANCTRFIAAVIALLIAGFLVEGYRVRSAWQVAWRSEIQRDRFAQELVALERHNRSKANELESFASLVRLRTKSGPQASQLAALGNAIGPHVGLLSLRRRENELEIEGRAVAIEDVASTVRRLQRSESARSVTFALKRDDSGEGFWFRLGLQR